MFCIASQFEIGFRCVCICISVFLYLCEFVFVFPSAPFVCWLVFVPAAVLSPITVWSDADGTKSSVNAHKQIRSGWWFWWYLSFYVLLTIHHSDQWIVTDHGRWDGPRGAQKQDMDEWWSRRGAWSSGKETGWSCQGVNILTFFIINIMKQVGSLIPNEERNWWAAKGWQGNPTHP